MPDKAGPGPDWPAPAGAVSPGECRRAAAALERLRAKLSEEEEWRGHAGRVAALRETLDSPLFAHVLALQRAVAHLKEQVRTMSTPSCVWVCRMHACVYDCACLCAPLALLALS